MWGGARGRSVVVMSSDLRQPVPHQCCEICHFSVITHDDNSVRMHADHVFHDLFSKEQIVEPVSATASLVFFLCVLIARRYIVGKPARTLDIYR
jgi:hypothetical protein